MVCLFGSRGNVRFCFYDHTSEVIEPLIDPRLDCFRVGIHEHLDLHFFLHGGEFPSLCSATIADSPDPGCLSVQNRPVCFLD